MQERESEKVTNGDIEFAIFLAESEDAKEQKKSFLTPGNIFRIYLETSYEDDSEDCEGGVIYNVYACIDGLYFMLATLQNRADAVRFAENSCIQLEKSLKQHLMNSVSSINFKKEDCDE